MTREGTRPLAVLLAAVLAAAVLAACGSSDSDSSSATSTEAGGSATDTTTAKSNSGQQSGGSAQSGGSQKASGDGSQNGGRDNQRPQTQQQGNNDSSGKSAAEVETPLKVSGGGSAQFRSKGGDNSIQEFGSEAPESEFDEAAAALHNFLDARAAGDWAATCSYMSKSMTESLEKLVAQAKQAKHTSCAEVLGKLTNPAAKQELQAEAAQADVGSLRIEGDRAFVIYTGIDKTVLAMPMAHEGGSWKVTSLAGTPLSY